MEAEDNDPNWLIPSPVREKALQEYGVGRTQAEQYQMDYLIPPSLGGTEDIGNLWPEPYSESLWNARAKDALENRLREMVCAGQLDLAAAQHDLATDWISAYKKYFHTDQPRFNHSELKSSQQPTLGSFGLRKKVDADQILANDRSPGGAPHRQLSCVGRTVHIQKHETPRRSLGDQSSYVRVSDRERMGAGFVFRPSCESLSDASSFPAASGPLLAGFLKRCSGIGSRRPSSRSTARDVART